MNKAKIVEFLKGNWKWLMTLIFATGGGITLGNRIHLQPGEKTEAYIIIAPDLLDIFGEQPAKAGAGKTFTPIAFKALRMAGNAERENTGERLRDTEDGRKLFAILQRLHNDPESLDEIEQAVKVTAIDPLTLSLIAKAALKVAIMVLERRAPRTESEWDDRLLALLKLFSTTPATINAAYATVPK